MENFKLTVLKYAESTIGENLVLYGGQKDRIWPISFFLYLIETVNRKILVDAGCNELKGFYLSRFIKPVDLLNKYGLKAEEITDLIITHAHYDHIALAKEFKNAVVYIQKDEYERGKAFLCDNEKAVTFDDFVKVTENITAVKVGGHSIGSSIVEISHENHLYVIAGDEAYSRECILRQIPTGACTNIENSRRFIETYKDSKYTVLYSHDMDVLPAKNGFLRLL
ncbi:MAG: MBL fold metallo-hydrolase [Clostridia bacterium]|nr:MBL fold metallo-hydrolase [Clostridia bacterium]